MEHYIHQISLPVRKGASIANREIHITTNGVEKTISIQGNVTDYRVIAKEGEDVSIFVVDLDKEGNRSEPSEVLTFQVASKGLQKPMTPTIKGVTKAMTPSKV